MYGEEIELENVHGVGEMIVKKDYAEKRRISYRQ